VGKHSDPSSSQNPASIGVPAHPYKERELGSQKSRREKNFIYL